MTSHRLVLRHILARPLRSTLTVGAIGLSVGLMGFLLVLSDALKQDWSPFMGQRVIVMGKSSFFDRLPMAYLPKLEEMPGVYRVTPFDFVVGFYRDNRPENQVPVSASDADTLLDVYVEANVPKDQVAAWKADPTGSIIGSMLRDKFGWKPGTHIVLKAPVRSGVIETTIRGVMEYKLDNGVYLHRRYLEQLSGDEGRVAMFWIMAKSRDVVGELTAAIERKFDNAPVPIRAMTEKQWQLMFMQMLGNVKAHIGSIGLATAFALVLITSNTLAMGARERRGETALLRVLGFARGTVLRLLLAEAVVYGLFGGAVGLALLQLFNRLAAAAIDKTQLSGMGALLNPTLGAALSVVGMAVGLAAVAGFVPAVNLSRRPIAQLLREAA